MGNRSNYGALPDALNIYVPVIPLIPCSLKDINIIQQAIQRATPYLENLSGLRYYPVPTYIIDEQTYLKTVKMPIGESEINEGSLREQLAELTIFTGTVCLDIHTRKLNPIQKLLRENPYHQFSRLNLEELRRLINYCEVGLGLNWIMDGQEIDPLEFHFAQLSTKVDLYDNLIDNLKEILAILKGIKEFGIKSGYEITLDLDYSHQLERWYGVEGDHPKLDVWESMLSSSDWKTILRCLDGSTWKRDISSIIAVLSIVINLLQEILGKLNLIKSGNIWITSKRHTFGVYLKPTTQFSSRIENIITREVPPYLQQPQVGKVLLCLERCERFAKRYVEEHDLKPEEILKGFLEGVLVHEHCHAISYEGINTNEDSAYRESMVRKKTHAKVSETLAEWAELNYFRNNKLMYDLVIEHANSGSFDTWPYAGALILESVDSSRQRFEFRVLLSYFRNNQSRAYSHLKAL